MNSVFTQTTPTIEFFCELTQKAYAPYIVDVSEVLLSSDGWTSLADLWEEMFYDTKKDAIADALHLIKWGIPFCKDSSLAYQKLVISISEVLLSDTPAYTAWIKHYFFKCCIDAITIEGNDRRYHPNTSADHFDFLTDQAILKLWRYSYGHKAACNAAARRLALYKTRIITLLPQALYWNPDAWLDEEHIFEEILHTHGADYRGKSTDYLIVSILLDSPRNLTSKTIPKIIKYLGNLETFSPSLAKCIWQNYDNSILCRMLLYAGELANTTRENNAYLGRCPTNYIDYQRLQKSWLYLYSCQQLYAGGIPANYTAKVKKAIFNISTLA